MIEKHDIDYSLYAILDQDWIRERDIVRLTEEILSGGATVLQYRNKSGSGLEFLRNAGMIRGICRQGEVPFIVNDRVDIAMAVHADGVHLGQDDLPVPVARRLTGEGMLLGLSVSDMKEMDSVTDVDYLGVGAIFPTQTKPEAEYSGIRFLKDVRKISDLPLVGIGGINPENIEQVIRAGADGVAIISAVLGAADVKSATQRIYGLIRKYKQESSHA